MTARFRDILSSFFISITWSEETLADLRDKFILNILFKHKILIVFITLRIIQKPSFSLTKLENIIVNIVIYSTILSLRVKYSFRDCSSKPQAMKIIADISARINSNFYVSM